MIAGDLGHSCCTKGGLPQVGKLVAGPKTKSARKPAEHTPHLPRAIIPYVRRELRRIGSRYRHGSDLVEQPIILKFLVAFRRVTGRLTILLRLLSGHCATPCSLLRKLVEALREGTSDRFSVRASIARITATMSCCA